MSLATRVILGLGLGILTGVFFGEEVAFLGAVGRGFVLLLRMGVLPFVAVSLVAGFGGLTPGSARSLVRFAGGSLLVLWSLTLAVVLLAPLAFPDWKAASFFSTSLVEERPGFDLLDVYIPSNPFRSLSEGVVPAVVVFSIAFGLALMGSPRKGPLLDALLAAQDALLGVTNAIVRLAPYGVFAIAAEAAGTLDVSVLRGLQVYASVHAGAALVLAFWIFPALVAGVTPLSIREVLGTARDALVTAFATGSVFVVLPILADRSNELLSERGFATEESRRLVDVAVPISFTLAGAGKLLSLVFVLFAGWLSGYPVALGDYPRFAVTGLASLFASTTVAIPFLLENFRIPDDTFRLFLISDQSVTGRFGSMLAAIHIYTLALLAACGVAGRLVARPRRLAAWVAVSAALVALALGTVRIAFEAVDTPYAGYRNFIQRSFLLPTAPWRDRDGPPERERASSAGALERARSRGSLRVGYAPDRLPYAFRNEAGQLVGFDVEMAHALARDLGVGLQFHRVGVESMRDLLNAGHLDVAMTGLAITLERLQQMAFSSPYLEETMAFVVLDHRRDEFRSRDAVKALEHPRLAVARIGYDAARIRAYLPQAEIGVIESPRAFFTQPDAGFDALVYSAEAGSAWTLIYPAFSVAVPHPDVLRVPLGYAVARRDREMADFLSAWIQLKRNDGTIRRLFDYWFRGKEPDGRRQRWSVLRDVLGRGRKAEAGEAPAEAAATAPAPATPAPAEAAATAPAPATPVQPATSAP
jgi:Na+/H+-dicarboxylate symporter/ABC-type amino acid transport substrate-binding protein